MAEQLRTGAILAALDTAADDTGVRLGRYRVSLSNLDKPLWPDARPEAVTKRDYLRYLVRVSRVLLPHLLDRPTFVVRAPDGVNGHRFFQKHFTDTPPFVRSLRIWTADEKKATTYVVPSNLATLLWLAQQAALELHVWFASVTPGRDGRGLGIRYAASEAQLERSRLNFPDVLVVDLDSYIYSGRERKGEEPELTRKGFDAVREVALTVRELLQPLGLDPFVKTSGKTGLHLYVPIIREFTFDDVRGVARAFGQMAERRLPDTVTLAWSVEDRAGKVFFDFNQNVRGKSLAAPYSPRLHPAATVSTPVTWDELPRVYPTDFTIHTVPERVEAHGDPWGGMLEHRHSLDAALGVVTDEPER